MADEKFVHLSASPAVAVVAGCRLPWGTSHDGKHPYRTSAVLRCAADFPSPHPHKLSVISVNDVWNFGTWHPWPSCLWQTVLTVSTPCAQRILLSINSKGSPTCRGRKARFFLSLIVTSIVIWLIGGTISDKRNELFARHLEGTISAESFDADILHAPVALLSPQSEGNPARGVCPRQSFLHW